MSGAETGPAQGVVAPDANSGQPSSPAPRALVPAEQTEAQRLQRELDAADGAKRLGMLTTLLNEYVQVNNVLPNDLEGFVKSGRILRLPPPPPGQRYVIDRNNLRVLLANR